MARNRLTGEIDPVPGAYGACAQEQSRGGRHEMLTGVGATGHGTGVLSMLLDWTYKGVNCRES